MIAVYSGVFLISAATLLLEITLTRIFSVTQGYHFAFMAVSLALLGFGASGTALTIFPRLLKYDVRTILVTACFSFAATTVASFYITNILPFDSFSILWQGRQLLYLALYYLILTVPFFFTGVALGAALAKVPERAGSIYGLNLVGSGAGCLLSLWGPPVLGPSGAIAVVSLLGVSATAFLSWDRLKVWAGPISLGTVALIVLMVGTPSGLDLKISPYKSISQALRPEGSERIWDRWDAVSRVEVIRSPGFHSAPGLSFTYPGDLPTQMAIAVDGENLSAITNARPSEAEFTGFLPTSLIYSLSPNPRVLLIDPQGGLDLLTALHHDAASVVAVMGNRLVFEAVTQRFSAEAAGIYNDPRVRVVVGGHRSYLKSTDEKFDVIQVSLADSFRPVVAGAFSISEDHLHTREGFQELYRHLEPNGFLATTRWIQVPPSEGIRVVSVAVDALEGEGVSHPEKHLAVIRTLQTLTVLVKRDELTEGDVGVIRDFSQRLQYDLVYHPGIEESDLNRFSVFPRPIYHDAVTSILSPEQRGDFYRDYEYDISPVSDGRPFFFHLFKWRQIPDVLGNLGKTFQPFGGAGFLVLLGLLLVTTAASILLIVAPLLLRRLPRRSTSGEGAVVSTGSVNKWRTFSYFAALGLGFLWIEIPLLQRFILFLDHPTYSFATVLFAILFWSGVGSLLSSRLSSFGGLVLLGVSALALTYTWALTPLFNSSLGLSLGLRLAIAVAALAPLGTLMGVPFPLGLAILGKRAPHLVPWAWAVNGSVSVISAVLATLLALSFGFSWVTIGAGAAYLLALGAIYPWLQEGRAKEKARV